MWPSPTSAAMDSRTCSSSALMPSRTVRMPVITGLLDIDAAGQVTGWSPWLAVPDWFLGLHAGADVTVADIDCDGVLDLVVLMVDAPEGRNQGYYRSGPLNADGTVTARRTWVAVPDWYFGENQEPESLSLIWTAMARRSSLSLQDNPPAERRLLLGGLAPRGPSDGGLGAVAGSAGLAFLGDKTRPPWWRISDMQACRTWWL